MGHANIGYEQPGIANASVPGSYRDPTRALIVLVMQL